MIETLVIVDSVRMLVRRPSLASAAALCIALCACSDGVGTPFIVSAEYSFDAAAATDAEPEPAMTERDTGTATTPPAPLRDAGTPKPSDCRSLDEKWPDEDKRAARELFARLSELRFDNKSTCRVSNVRPWKPSSQLECSARMRFEEEAMERWTATTPAFEFIEDTDEALQAVDRMERAGVPTAGLGGYELVISNAESVESIVEAVEAQLPVLCRLVWPPYSELVGAARRGHVWVVDFAPAPPSQGDPRPGPGGGH